MPPIRLYFNFENDAASENFGANVDVAINILERAQTQMTAQIRAATEILQNRVANIPNMNVNESQVAIPNVPNAREEQHVFIPMLWENPRGQTRFSVEMQGNQLLIRVSRRRR